jgi:hypothetical protein
MLIKRFLFFLAAGIILVCPVLASEQSDRKSASNGQETGREITDEESSQPEIIIPPERGVDYQVREQLKGTGLIFSPGAPGGVRPANKTYRKKHAPRIKFIIINLPKEKEESLKQAGEKEVKEEEDEEDDSE